MAKKIGTQKVESAPRTTKRSKSGRADTKVTSRKQKIAVGGSQARSVGRPVGGNVASATRSTTTTTRSTTTRSTK